MATQTKEAIEEKIKSKGKQVGAIKDLERPWGVTVHEDKIVAIESDKHCVTICNKEGQKITSFGENGGKQGQFKSPLGVAVTPDAHILVIDQLRLQKFNLDGTFVVSSSCRKIDFRSPFALAVNHKDGSIYIADAEKHEIIVVKPDLSRSFAFGTKGSEEGEFNKPRSVAVNSEGKIYVADGNNDRVCKFSPDGKFLSHIGTGGQGAGQLDRPSAVAIDSNDYVYVTEMINGRVFVYDSQDQLVHCFGRCGSKEGEYSGPQGITIDQEGDVIISDTYNNRLVIV